MSDLNRALLAAYRQGATHTTMQVLSSPAAHRVHRYLLDVANDSPDTYTTLDDVKELLNIPHSTAYRIIKALDCLKLLDSRRGTPQRKDGRHGAGGSGAIGWRAKL